MFYFAYGSNLSLDQMRARCPEARPVRRHRLTGYRLVLRGVANVEPAPGETVEGALYEVSEQDEAKLDGYENFPVLYERETFETPDGPAYFYKMVEPHFKEPREGYVETIEAGYQDWEIPAETLERAKARQAEEYGSIA